MSKLMVCLTSARRLAVVSVLLAVLSAGTASAKIDACQPDGMADAEAARILAIGTAQGKAFRKAIDALRAGGMSMKTDTTYATIIADPDRALALAKERREAQRTPRLLEPDQSKTGEDLDAAILKRIDYWINKRTTNYYTAALYDHLGDLAVSIGGKPADIKNRFEVNLDTYIFALTGFVRGAEWELHWDYEHEMPEYGTVRYAFSEAWPLFRADGFGQVWLNFTTGTGRKDLSVENSDYSRV